MRSKTQEEGKKNSQKNRKSTFLRLRSEFSRDRGSPQLRRADLSLTHADSQHHVTGRLFSLSAFSFKGGGATGTDIGMKGREESLAVEGKSIRSVIPRQKETRVSRSEQTRPERK